MKPKPENQYRVTTDAGVEAILSAASLEAAIAKARLSLRGRIKECVQVTATKGGRA
jgi:hypothetical protein